jgi:hypothetical protein
MMPKGHGVRKRHSTGCPAKEGAACSCNAGWEASVYLAEKQKKLRRTFDSEAEAMMWRRDQLRRLYAARPRRTGKLDEGYSLLRKATQEFDRAMHQAEPPLRAYIREALEAAYRAEDAALEAMARR